MKSHILLLIGLIIVVPALYAGIIELKDGRQIHIPDQLVVFFDTEKIELTSLLLNKGINEKAVALSLNELQENEEIEIDLGNILKIRVNQKRKVISQENIIEFLIQGAKYPVVYPTYSHPEKNPNFRSRELFTAFKYKLSDIKQHKKDSKGLTVQMTDQEYRELMNQK